MEIHKNFGDRERPKKTKETVVTSGDACKYKLNCMKRQRDRRNIRLCTLYFVLAPKYQDTVLEV